MKSLRLPCAALLLALIALIPPAAAVIDNGVCTAADQTGCTGTNLKNNANEEIGATNKRAPAVLTGVTGTNQVSGSTAPATAALADGMSFWVKPAVTNTGPVQLNVGTGLFDLTAATGAALAAGEFSSTTRYLVSYYAAGNQFRLPAMGAGGGGVSDGDKGDVVISGSGTVYTVDAAVITNAKLAAMASARLKGRVTAGSGDPEDLTGTQATTLLDPFTSALKGVAPASGGGTANYLRADGTWVAPPGNGLAADGNKGDITISGTGTVYDVNANAVALTTDTTGSYAAGDAEAGNALTGDSATAFFTSGLLEVARGGHGAAPTLDDQVFVSTSATTGAWGVLPDSDAAGTILGYDITTNAWSTKADDDVPEAGDFGALSATSPITQSGGTISTSISTSRLVGRTTAAAGVMEQITPDATLNLSGLALGVVDVTCTGCLGATEIAALDAGDTTTGAFADARVDGSLEADEVNPTLGTQTQGNFQTGNTAGRGIAITQTPAEGFSSTVAFDFTDAGADPAYAAGECVFTNGGAGAVRIVCEGDTADAVESVIVFTEPTTTDKFMTIPDANSNPVQPLTCGGTDKVSAISSTGVVTCTTDAGGAGSGDNITVNGAAATDGDFDDATPAAAAGGLNVIWQKDAGTPNNISAYVPLAVQGPASATDNAITRFDATTGKLIQNSTVTLSDTGVANLPLAALPSAPATDTLNLLAKKRGGRMMAAVQGPSGLDTSLQGHFAFNAISQWQSIGNSATLTAVGDAALTATGTATAANVATTNRHTYMRRVETLVTVAATTAVAGFRAGAAKWGVGGAAAGDGGFYFACRFGPATGVATTTHRLWVGMSNSTAAPTDVEPSTIANSVGVGYDAADTNMQMMHRGAGAITKIDLGSNFPVPTTDRTKAYELVMFSKPGTTQEVGYEVTDLATGNVASGLITTNMPSTATLLAPRAWMSVGGTSSVIGIALMNLYVESDY